MFPLPKLLLGFGYCSLPYTNDDTDLKLHVQRKMQAKTFFSRREKSNFPSENHPKTRNSPPKAHLFTRILLWKLLISPLKIQTLRPAKVWSPSREKRFIPIRKDMSNQSFRDILLKFLDEKTPNSPAETTAKVEIHADFPSETPHFHWSMTDAVATEGSQFYVSKAKTAYPRPPSASSAFHPKAPPAPPKMEAKPEMTWDFAELNNADQRRVKILVQMGANEINGTISESRLKKAYRRLVRSLHPDAIPAGSTAAQKKKSQEDFLALQSIYEELSDSLKERSSQTPKAA